MSEQPADTLVRVHSLTGPAYGATGPLSGRLVHVLRLGLCNLTCEWCDVPETWNRDTIDTVAPLGPVSDLAKLVAAQLDADPTVPLLITGGEPLLQDYALLELLQRLNGRPDTWQPLEVYVETNGTKTPPEWWIDYVDHTIISPKVGTHDAHHKRLNDRALTRWAELATNPDGLDLASFGFTVRNRSDVLLAASVCTWLGLSPADVWLTPEGSGHDRQLTSLAAIYDTAAEHGFRLSLRPHHLITEPVTVVRREVAL